jgi:hypothetical protein
MATRLTRTQALVLVFLAASWLVLLAILALAPEVYDRTLRTAGGEVGPARAAFLAALSAFLSLLALGVVRRWRWTFWLIAVAFLAGALRVVASVLQIAGVLPASDPVWYLALQGAIGLVQVPIGALMLLGRRRGGAWSSF